MKTYYELSYAQKLLQQLGIRKALQPGDPKKREPDTIFENDGRRIGIEITDAYYTQ